MKDIQIENCVLWSTLANVYRVGFSWYMLITDIIVMKNTYLIHMGRGEWYASWSVICSIVPEKQVLESWEVKSPGRGKAIHTNYLFENVRFEEAIAFLGIQDEAAEFRNIVFRNITMSGNPVPSLVMCAFDGLSFENVKVNGKPVRGKDDVPFGEVTKEIINLKFK